MNNSLEILSQISLENLSQSAVQNRREKIRNYKGKTHIIPPTEIDKNEVQDQICEEKYIEPKTRKKISKGGFVANNNKNYFFDTGQCYDF